MFKRAAAPATGRLPVASRIPLPGSGEERTARGVEGVARERLPVEQVDVLGGGKGRASRGAEVVAPKRLLGAREALPAGREYVLGSGEGWSPRSVRQSPRACTCPRSTGSHSRGPTAAPRDARPLPPTNTSSHPTASRSSATTSASRDARSPPLPCKESNGRRDRRSRGFRRCKMLKHPSSAASRAPIFSNRSPVAATAPCIAQLTTRSRARSAGSSNSQF